MSSMKVVLLTIFLFLSITFASPLDSDSDESDEGGSEISQAFTACNKEHDIIDYEKLMNGFSTLDEDMKHKVGCFEHCIFEKLDFLKDGKIDVEKVDDKYYKKMKADSKVEMNGKATKTIFKECADKTNAKTFEDKCNMLVDVMSCIDSTVVTSDN